MNGEEGRAGRRRAIFLDRDGVLICLVPYPSRRHQVRLYPGVGDALRSLRAAGFLLVLVTNQSAVARGLLTPVELHALHRALQDELRLLGAQLDAIYVCPHHPRSHGACGCRKPEPGLLLRAQAELDVDLSRSFLIGDRLDDLEAARRAGVRGILVRSGYGCEEVKRPRARGVIVVEDLSEAARRILDLQHRDA